MGSRFVIARPDPSDPAKWNGVYGHADGYPAEAGKWLFSQVVGHFQGDLAKAAAYYIDDHPAGWRGLDEAFGRNECYCHDMGEGVGNTAFETELGATGMDWTYVLRPEGLEVRKWGRLVTTIPWGQERVVWEDVKE